MRLEQFGAAFGQVDGQDVLGMEVRRGSLEAGDGSEPGSEADHRHRAANPSAPRQVARSAGGVPIRAAAKCRGERVPS